MARGVPNDLLDHPTFKTCWCGVEFKKKTRNQEHCCPEHRVAAFYGRIFIPNPPPPAVPQRKRPKPEPSLDPK
jgi:hypothetical protein